MLRHTRGKGLLIGCCCRVRGGTKPDSGPSSKRLSVGQQLNLHDLVGPLATFFIGNPPGKVLPADHALIKDIDIARPSIKRTVLPLQAPASSNRNGGMQDKATALKTWL
jgi:hypothetical protein